MSDSDMSMTSSDRSSGRKCSDSETDEYCRVVCRQVSTAANKFLTTGPVHQTIPLQKKNSTKMRTRVVSLQTLRRETAKSDPSVYSVKKNSSALCMSANLGYTDPKLIFLDTDRGNDVEERAKYNCMLMTLSAIG